MSMKERKAIVQTIRITKSVFEQVYKEAKEEDRTISRLISDILEERYKNVINEKVVINDNFSKRRWKFQTTKELKIDDRICYPIDNIPGKPLKAANRVWLKGEIVTYGDLVHKIYKQHKIRIVKADLRGVPLDQTIKEIENE